MLNEAKIKLKEKEYTISKSFRSLMLFEELSGKSIDKMKESITDLMLLLYCMLKVTNKETFKYTLDEFIDVVDEVTEKGDEKPMDDFNNFLLKEATPENKKKVVKKQ